MAEKEEKCSNCPLRAKYDKKPKSLLGRFWRWHIKFCPGWKGYFSALPSDEQQNLIDKYSLKPQ